MKKKLDERLRLEIIDYKITNTNQVLENIIKINDYEMLKEYYDFYNNGNIIINQYENLDVILFAIKSRLKTLEVKAKLKEDLENAKKLNKGLENVYLMETNKENNDVNKDATYLKYINKDGSLTILEITNLQLLSNLILAISPVMSTEDFIKLLKNRYFRELPTFGMGKHEISVLEYEHSSIIPDKENYEIEKERLNLDYPDIVPKVSIDTNQERLYHIGSTVIKFHDENGKRQKTILSDDGNTQDVTNENKIEYSNKTNIMYKNESDIKINRDELEGIEIDEQEAWYLVNNYANQKNLELKNQMKVYAFLLECLSKIEAEQTLTETEEYLLGISIDFVRKNEINRNNIEQEIFNRYNAFYNSLDNESYELNANTKKKTYSSVTKSAVALTNEGISLTIIIITTTVIIGTFIAALLLVK